MKFVKLIWSELIIICWRRKNTIFKLIWEIYIYTQIKFYQPIKSFWFADLASFFYYCYFIYAVFVFFLFKPWTYVQRPKISRKGKQRIKWSLCILNCTTLPRILITAHAYKYKTKRKGKMKRRPQFYWLVTSLPMYLKSRGTTW